MHGASFRPRILAGYALRALSWHDLRSVRSFLHARSAFPASFRGFRHARSVILASGMHGARFPPRPVAEYAPRAFSIPREHARSVFLAITCDAICAPCIPPASASTHGAAFLTGPTCELRPAHGSRQKTVVWFLSGVRQEDRASLSHGRSALVLRRDGALELGRVLCLRYDKTSAYQHIRLADA